MERRDIFRRVLENPGIYSRFQNLVGARPARRRIVAEIIRPRPGERILDIGCGPADILEDLPEIDYTGIDYSQSYIEAARRRFGARGSFRVADVRTLAEEDAGRYDLAIATGVLHHLDDGSVVKMLRDVRRCLRPGGRFVALDPLIEYPQHPVARFLARIDRGRHVRTLDAYGALAREAFGGSFSLVPRRDLLRLPYSHAVLTGEA